MVHFVGAGPGAVDLITVRGMQLLGEADVAIYAGSLVNRKLLDFCNKDCRRYDSAKMSLEEIVAVMAEADAKGEEIVRLHSGDPSLYGAIREQMDCLIERGIDYDCTPGVTAAFGAAASLRMEYTLPERTQTLILTRLGGRTPVPERERMALLAMHQSSMAIYLSAGEGARLRDELLLGGYPPETPVTIVYRATWPEELVICSNVNKFVDKLKEHKISQTAVILVGEAAGQGDIKTWINSGRSIQRSKLYDPEFETGFRKAEGKADGSERILEDESAEERFDQADIESSTLLHGSRTAGTKIPTVLDVIFFTDASNRRVPQVAEEIIADKEGTVLLRQHFYGERPRTDKIVREAFERRHAILFVGAMGIAVRKIAPYIRDKQTDSAVLVMDSAGEYVIPVLSGHIGGANDLCRRIAERIGAEPVITTGTDVKGKFAIDVYAVRQGLLIGNREGIRFISGKLLNGKDITITIQDDRYKGNVSDLSENVMLIPWDNGFGADRADVVVADEGRHIGSNGEERADVVVADRDRQIERNESHPALLLHPKRFVLGIGCKRDIEFTMLRNFIKTCLNKVGIAERQVRAIASLDRKWDERCLLEYAVYLRVPFQTFTAEELVGLPGQFHGSRFVEEMVGIDNVCERAAMAGAGVFGTVPKMRLPKQAENGITLAVAEFDPIITF